MSAAVRSPVLNSEIAEADSRPKSIETLARSFNVYTHEEDIILSTHITFVRIDEEGNPIPISDKVKETFKLGSNNKNVN